jgi:hypothetical protein
VDVNYVLNTRNGTSDSFIMVAQAPTANARALMRALWRPRSWGYPTQR